jgi:ABC-2 type transport system ATP-binding protein
MSAIIETRGLAKRFGGFVAVDGLSIAVERGSIFAFLGANGSGKSTTIRMLIGVLQPSEGAISVDGVDVIATPRRVRDRIGYMGQKVSLYQGLTLRENVEFYAGLYGLEGAALERRWGDVRERLDLAASEGGRPEDLPAGIRQRAGLALATLHEPRILFLDEPTAGVDVESRGLFWDRIQEEAERGVTVFVTTHFLEEVEYCDWVSFIESGRLVADATPEELRRRFSPGYRIRLSVDARARAAAVRTLTEAGLRLVSANGRLELAAPALDARALAALHGVAATDLVIEQPPMNDVFRRIMAGSDADGTPA